MTFSVLSLMGMSHFTCQRVNVNVAVLPELLEFIVACIFSEILILEYSQRVV